MAAFQCLAAKQSNVNVKCFSQLRMFVPKFCRSEMILYAENRNKICLAFWLELNSFMDGKWAAEIMNRKMILWAKTGLIKSAGIQN